jgi:hypothetical protein
MAADFEDRAWFDQWPKRQARIRSPNRGEKAEEFRTLGPHNTDRRRILVWRVPVGNPMRGMLPDGLMRIPFLAFSDEEIRNEDSVLLPLLHQIMAEAQAEMPHVIV